MSGSGAVLQDDAPLEGHAELQLVLLDLGQTSQDQAAELIVAADDNNTSKVEILLQRPQDPNLAVRGHTPLFCAAFRGHLQVVSLLLEASADADTCGRLVKG